MRIAIVGDGICGLSLALNLHRHGIFCRVYERAPQIKELGSGSPSCRMRFDEFDALGFHTCEGGIVRTIPSSVSSTGIWQLRRLLGFRAEAVESSSASSSKLIFGSWPRKRSST